MTTILSTIGMLLVLIAYFLMTNNKICEKEFHILNTIGAVFLLISSVQLSAYAFVVLNACWICIGLKGISKKR